MTGSPEETLKHFEPGALETIERILGAASPDASLRFELALAISKCAESRGQGQARPAVVSSRLKTIHTSAQQLRGAVKGLMLDETAEAAEIAIMLMGAGLDLSSSDWDAFVDTLDTLATATTNVPQSKGGRPPENVDRAVMLTRIGAIYHERTGRRPTVTAPPDRDGGVFSGDFFRIAALVDQAAASLAGIEPMENWSLGDLLCKIFKGRNPS